jgi:hypothetical protein
MEKQAVFDTILQNLTYSDEQIRRWDALTPTDPDYMMYSPFPVGYNTTSEQRFLMQNILVGYSGGSLLDVGCGRCDLYGVAQELAALNNDTIAYTAIDHNPIMTQLGEKKWGLTDIRVGSFETALLPVNDWVVASGIFTERRCETENDDLIKLIDNIDLLYNAANQVVSFNLLNPINTTHHEGFFYVHPGLILDMLIEKYQYVTIRNNYSPDVYSITIYKY